VKTVSILIAAAAALMMTGPASANTLVILPEAAAPNAATVTVTGSHNSLQIAQNYTGAAGQSGNSATVSIEGDFNGSGTLSAGLAPSSLRIALDADLPDGGRIVQSGFDNSLALAVLGTGNLFSFVQQGSANMASGTIHGLGNQASVQQIGQNNIAAFSQNGNGNIVSISQTSW
jgi:hypothetical protein